MTQFVQNKRNTNVILHAWFAAEEMRKVEGEKPFSTVKHARERLDFIQEIASRSITLNKIINKNNTLIILCNLQYIIKSSGKFIFTFLSFKTLG
jgi:hypothetical protein